MHLFKIRRYGNLAVGAGHFAYPILIPENEGQVSNDNADQEHAQARCFSGTLRTDGVSAHWVIDRPVSESVTQKIEGYPEKSDKRKQKKATPPDLRPFAEVMRSGPAIYVDPGRRDLATAISDSQVKSNLRRATGKLSKKTKGKSVPRLSEKATGKRQMGDVSKAKGKDGSSSRKRRRHGKKSNAKLAKRRRKRAVRKAAGNRKWVAWEPGPGPGGGGGGEGDGGSSGSGAQGSGDGDIDPVTGMPTSIPCYKPVSISNREWRNRAGHTWAEKARAEHLRRNDSVFFLLIFI